MTAINVDGNNTLIFEFFFLKVTFSFPFTQAHHVIQPFLAVVVMQNIAEQIIINNHLF